jgi:hypothetical protein
MGSKSANGEGGFSFNTTFDPDIPEESRALEVARQKAMPHGQRKRLLVAFFNAIADYEEMTGREFTASTVTTMFMTMGFAGNRPSTGPNDLPPLLEDIEIRTTVKVDKEKAAQNFATQRGNLFG